MRAWIGAIWNAVAVDIEVAAEIGAGLQLLVSHDLAAIVNAAIIPSQRCTQAVVHADIEIEHDKNRRLQAVGEIKESAPNSNASFGSCGNSKMCLVSPCEA